MPRPKDSATGKVTKFRRDLDTWREEDRDRFEIEILRVKAIYRAAGSNIAKTAKVLGVGKRTLERAMRDVSELAKAINDVRVLQGR